MLTRFHNNNNNNNRQTTARQQQTTVDKAIPTVFVFPAKAGDTRHK